MKSLANEIKRRIRTETSFLCGPVPFIMCAAAVALGIFFAIGGIDGEMCDELEFPHLYVGAVPMILLYALALAALAFSAACAVYSPSRPRKKDGRFARALYAVDFALIYIWIPLTFKAGTFFASLILCCVGCAVSCLLFRMICCAGRLCRVGLYIFFAWQIYLAYISAALFIIN